ncbi:MAG: nucleotidyl transferase [Acidobacteria bacterium RIFCSPLOWO2_02_FULL_64_15]|nr:MAG: nucleotidyl transferase [Acidobacteria bacterium RIFCSPLOWO2_02_FULL_64_15]
MSVAILAGGLATRLRPITEQIPKSLVDVAGKPFAAHQVELLRRHGLTDIVFLVGHLGEMVRDALGDGTSVGVRLRYVFDGPGHLGTGGAVRNALPALSDPFFVLYGDSYLECDYQAIEQAFATAGKNGLMTVYRNNDQWDRSNVLFEEGRIIRYDKHPTPDMRHIDYGLGIFRKVVFAEYARASADLAFDLAEVYQKLVAESHLAGFEVPKRFYEIGSPAGLDETRAHLAAKGVAAE